MVNVQKAVIACGYCHVVVRRTDGQ